MFRSEEFEDLKERGLLSYGYYEGNEERVTIDGEWTEEELKGDISDEVIKIMSGTNGKKGWVESNKHRALYNKDLTLVEYVTTAIVDELDVIEIYNKELDKHKNDSPVLFGIHYFDEYIDKKILETLNSNIVK